MRSWPFYDPQTDPLHQFAVQHETAYRYTSHCLWGLAILFTLGDILTTWTGLTAAFGDPPVRLYESIPFTAWVMDAVGLWAFAPLKGLTLWLAWWISRCFPRPYPLGIALTVTVLNVIFTLHNLRLLMG